MVKLRAWLKANKIRQGVFAGRLGISQGHLSDLLGGKSSPRPELAAKIEAETGGAIPYYEWPAYAVFAPQAAE